MNSFIENLNQWGGNFLSFAWPMLWQSSLLIGALFALDLLFRHRLRASIRYAFWLVVLVKLCVPPTLALPTSPAWWLHQTPLPVVAKPVPHYTVTYDNGPLPEIPQTTLPTFVPSKPVMANAAWLLATLVAVSSALLCWLLVRWWQITLLVRRAAASERLTSISDAAQGFVGMKLKVQVKVTANSMSPAVCGLFRPAILIPQSLAENFSDEQMRAVLLHELIHLRRRDVWLTFVQALLQIIYWWHPLVWLANAHIRRVREEAVDDAVMLALRDESEAYAPTLLEVAKLALNRPLASLGLVGILESRHALRQRIERLIDFRPPQRAGLTLVSLLGILAFTAVAVPMGNGPSSSGKNNLPATPALVTSLSSTPTNAPVIVIQAEIYRIRQIDFEKLISDPAFVNTRNDEVKNFQQFERLVKSSGFSPIARPRIQTSSGMPAQFYVGNETNSIEFESLPLVTNGLIKLANHIKMISTVESVTTTNNTDTQTTLQNGGGQIFSIRPPYDPGESNLIVVTVSAEIVTNRGPYFQQRLQATIKPAGENGQSNYNVKGAERKAIVSKLEHIRLDTFSSAGLPLSEVLRQLAEQSRLRDTNHAGINFLIDDHEDNSGVPATTINPLTGMPILIKTIPSSGQPSQTNPVTGIVYNSADVPVTVAAMQGARLAEVLDAVVMGASRPIKYSIQDYGVRFSAHDPSVPVFYTRSFKTDTNIFPSNLMRQAVASGFVIPKDFTNSMPLALRNVFRKAGVDLDSPPGKSVYYNYSHGVVFVRATAKDLDLIDSTVQKLNGSPPQIHIKARFLEVPKGTLAGLKNVISVTNPPAGSNQVAGLVGILVDKNFQTVLRNLKTHPGAETLAEPEAVTTSGRQTQMRATVIQSIITNFVFEEMVTNVNSVLVTNNAITPKLQQIESGPIVDVVPHVLVDGITIDLKTTASQTEFWGYAFIPTNAPLNAVTNSAGEEIDLPLIWPVLQISRATADVSLHDGETLLMALNPPEQIRFAEPDEKREAVVAKHIRDGQKKNKGGERETIVFITATLVDPAGNRIHPER